MAEKTIKNGKQKIYIEQFSGIGELVRAVEGRPVPEQWKGPASINVKGELNDKKFYGYDRYEEARKALLDGVNVKDMKKARADGLGDFSKARTVRQDKGSLPCIPAYLSNDPRAMYARKPVRTKGAYNVFVNVSYSWKATKKQVKEAGARILSSITRLEQEQPVNLWVGMAVDDGGQTDVIAVKIKDAGKPFNASRVSFALTDTAFLRVFCLAWQERNEHTNPNYGHGRPLMNHELDAISGRLFKNTICISMQDEINRG